MKKNKRCTCLKTKKRICITEINISMVHMYIYFYGLLVTAEAFIIIIIIITDLLYKANLNTGSVLEYALAFTSAALDKYCSKWSAAPKTGFIDITISKDFYRIYSGLQIVRSNFPQFSFIFFPLLF